MYMRFSYPTLNSIIVLPDSLYRSRCRRERARDMDWNSII